MKGTYPKSAPGERKNPRRELKETLILMLLGGSGLFFYIKGLSLFKAFGANRTVGIIFFVIGCVLIIALSLCHFFFDYAPKMGYRKGIVAYIGFIALSAGSSFLILRIISN